MIPNHFFTKASSACLIKQHVTIDLYFSYYEMYIKENSMCLLFTIGLNKNISNEVWIIKVFSLTTPANSHATGLYQLIPIHGSQGRQLPIEW